MLLSKEIFSNKKRRWIYLGRDPDCPNTLIDSNQFIIFDGNKALLPDPGGLEIFPSVIAAISRETSVDNIESIFASHQDPDIISSLSMWYSINPHVEVYSSWVWGKFIPHFGNAKEINEIPDEGMTLRLGSSEDLKLIPAHYCHASGNFSLYDPVAKILFSGDIGAAILPPGTSIFVENFERHIRNMEVFHKRWMPSNRAKNAWVQKVRELDIEIMCPQHGSLFRKNDVSKFLDWFEQLNVGSAIQD